MKLNEYQSRAADIVIPRHELEVGADINQLVDNIHHDNRKAGWWNNANGQYDPLCRNVPEMLCLIHSEISEAMEGHRKSLMDHKLENRLKDGGKAY